MSEITSAWFAIFLDIIMIVYTLFLPKLADFMQRIKQLPYFEKTMPPHWKE